MEFLHCGWRTGGNEVALGVDGQDPEAVRVPAERVDRAPLLRAHGLDWWGRLTVCRTIGKAGGKPVGQ